MSKTKIGWSVSLLAILTALLAYVITSDRSGTGSTQEAFDSLPSVSQMHGLPIKGEFRWERPFLSRAKLIVNGHVSTEQFGDWIADPVEARRWRNLLEMHKNDPRPGIEPYRKAVSYEGITALLHVDVTSGRFQLQEYATH